MFTFDRIHDAREIRMIWLLIGVLVIALIVISIRAWLLLRRDGPL